MLFNSTRRFTRRSIILSFVILLFVALAAHSISPGENSSLPEVAMVTLDLKGNSRLKKERFAETMIRSIPGVTSATVRGSIAGVTFHPFTLNEQTLVKKINAAGIYFVSVHQFDKKDLANVCPVPPVLHGAIVKVKQFFNL